MKTVALFSIILSITICKGQKPKITKIDFQAEACFGECPIFTMSVSEDGIAHYHAEMFNNQQGEFQAVIKKPQLDSLKMLIEQANIISLKDNYSRTVTDQPTYTLKVQFSNGERKSIRDYGPSGPHKLEKIYNLLFSLRETQDWR